MARKTKPSFLPEDGLTRAQRLLSHGIMEREQELAVQPNGRRMAGEERLKNQTYTINEAEADE